MISMSPSPSETPNNPSPGYRIRPFGILYTLYAILLFLLLMVLILPFVLLAAISGRIRGGNRVLKIIRVWGDIWFFMVGIRQRKIGYERLPPDGACIFVANHRCYLDAALIIKAIPVSFRPLGIAEVRKIPLFGFIYRQVVILLDKKDAESRLRSIRELKRFLQHGISVLIFPEGYLNESDKPLRPFFDGAFRIAIENGIPICPLVFLDNKSRMPAGLFSLTPGISRVKLLPRVDPAGYSMETLSLLKQKVYDMMEEEIVSSQ